MALGGPQGQKSTPKPGVYRDIDRAAYESWAGARSSTLKAFERSPMHAAHAMSHPKSSPAFELGDAMHTAILEPERFKAEWIPAPKGDRRTKEGKAAWKEFLDTHTGFQVLPEADYQQCLFLREAVWSHSLASQLLAGAGASEVSVSWQDATTFLPCKSRLDRFTEYLGTSAIVELKSAQDASPSGFQRAVVNFGYDLACAFYLDGLDVLSPVPRRFFFIVIEKDPPFAVAVYEPDIELIEVGRMKYRRALDLYNHCMRTQTWPGYREEIVPLSLPPWALKNLHLQSQLDPEF